MGSAGFRAAPAIRSTGVGFHMHQCQGYSVCSLLIVPVLAVIAIDVLGFPAPEFKCRSVVQRASADPFPTCGLTAQLCERKLAQTVKINY